MSIVGEKDIREWDFIEAYFRDIFHALIERNDDIKWKREMFERISSNCGSETYSGRKIAKLRKNFSELISSELRPQI